MITWTLLNLIVLIAVIRMISRYSPGNDFINKELSLFEGGWLGFLIVVGLFHLFNVLERKNPEQPISAAIGIEDAQRFSLLVFFILIHLGILIFLSNKTLNSNRK